MNLDIHHPPTTTYSQLSREILQQLRGGESQLQVSRRLGYSYNQVGKWESGHTCFYWQDFVHLCQIQKIDWQSSLREIFMICSDVDLDQTPIIQILRDFYGYRDVSELARHMSKSLSSARRLLTDQVKVDFADVLSLLGQRPLQLLIWLEKFLEVSKLHSLQAKLQYRQLIYQGLLKFPWAPEVNAALQLEGYRELPSHSSEWLANKTKLSLSHVEIAVRELESTGHILWQENKYLSSLLSGLIFKTV